jgi:hypothetical protein
MHVNALRSERGGILAISALIIPGFLLLTALVLDTGIWFTHKRSLQNRADSAALAAGVEYLSQLSSCAANPAGPAATAIADKARLYAGATSGYNQTVNNQAEVTVKINATGPTAADNSDGGNPCQDHPVTTPPDDISPNGGIWTDVIVRETNLRTVAGMFGLNLPSMAARARVELSQITGLTAGGLPFIHETGDYVDCVWAQFIDAANPGTPVAVINGSNPVLLIADPNTPRRWTADVDGITFPNGKDDLAVKYWMGSATGGSCDFSTPQKSAFAGSGPLDKFGNPTGTAPLDWINVYDNDHGGGGGPPELHSFQIRPGTCGPDRVGYIYSSNLCTITFSAWVDGDQAPNRITVISSNSSVTPANATPSGSSGAETFYSSTMSFDPNAVSGKPNIVQDYTQVGQHLLKVRWTMNSGQTLTSSNDENLVSPARKCTTSNPCICTSANPCIGEFKSEVSGNWQHQTYVADPVNSTPLYYAELLSGGTPMQNSFPGDDGHTGPFQVVLTNEGIDQQHVAIIRSSVQGTGNLTLAIKCGWKSNSAEELEDAVIDGCPAKMAVNQRGDSCTPEPPLASGAWDCVESVPGNKTGKVSSGMTRRFASPCTINHWSSSSPDDLNPRDPRFAYIFLTSFGRVATGTGWYPIKAFLRVYITGADGMGCPGDDPPPRGFSGKGSEVWGHLVDIVTLDDNVVTGSTKCDLSVAVLNCKPALVR